jgi:hypothetical protein
MRNVADLKDSNAILLDRLIPLLGWNSSEFDDEPHLNASFIVNQHPMEKGSSIYTNDAAAPSHRTYAVADLIPKLN